MTEATPPKVTQDSGVTVVELGEEYENLNQNLLDDVTDTLLEIANSADPPLVVLDLSYTTFFGTAFLEILFRMWNRLQLRDGGRLALCGLVPNCAKVLSVSQLDQLWTMFDSRDLAVQEMSPA